MGINRDEAVDTVAECARGMRATSAKVWVMLLVALFVGFAMMGAFA